ncbi:hypothetical protein [Kriegella aquimaris]|uniref:hypothetical protein n=1 Tax=Kriegella aquimaris TaxID=192904 RepID=UPI000B7E113E|nr:hypothetical protein [Kriegella aquimaris]
MNLILTIPAIVGGMAISCAVTDERKAAVVRVPPSMMKSAPNTLKRFCDGTRKPYYFLKRDRLRRFIIDWEKGSNRFLRKLESIR